MAVMARICGHAPPVGRCRQQLCPVRISPRTAPLVESGLLLRRDGDRHAQPPSDHGKVGIRSVRETARANIENSGNWIEGAQGIGDLAGFVTGTAPISLVSRVTL